MPKAALTRIQRRGNGHSYYLDGVRCPGVTSLLGDGLPKPALVNWAAKVTAQYVVSRLDVVPPGFTGEHPVRVSADRLIDDAYAYNETRPYGRARINRDVPVDGLALENILSSVKYAERDEAAKRGTEVHQLAQRIAHGEEVDVPEPLIGHVDAYIRFLDEWDPRNAHVETVIINRRWNYMGQVDLIADFDHMAWTDGPLAGEPMGRGLLDIKTTKSGIFPETGLQVEAYANGETMIVDHKTGEEAPMPDVDFVGAIWVRADGYDVHTFDRGGGALFRTFLYAAELGRWLGRDGDSGLVRSDALTPPEPIGPKEDQ